LNVPSNTFLLKETIYFRVSVSTGDNLTLHLAPMLASVTQRRKCSLVLAFVAANQNHSNGIFVSFILVSIGHQQS
jgi:hypothetical protein